MLTGQYIFQDFAHIMSCLGPLTDAEWFGCTSLPGYTRLKVAEMSAEVSENTVPTVFQAMSR